MASVLLAGPGRTVRRGFSLIEILITIAVVAVLAGIMIPTIGSSRESALHVQNTSNLRSLGMAMLSYAAENGGQLPLTTNENNVPRYTTGQGMSRPTGPFRLLGESFKPARMQTVGDGYVTTADIFYGPFTPAYNARRAPAPSGFYEYSNTTVYMGYFFYSLPVVDGGSNGVTRDTPGPINENLYDGHPRAPLFSDLVGEAVVAQGGGQLGKVGVVHLDGSVTIFPKDIHDLGHPARIRRMANWK